MVERQLLLKVMDLGSAIHQVCCPPCIVVLSGVRHFYNNLIGLLAKVF